MSDEKKDLEIVAGDGSELDISPAYDHLNVGTPKNTNDKKPKNIVIPEEKHKHNEENE